MNYTTLIPRDKENRVNYFLKVKGSTLHIYAQHYNGQKINSLPDEKYKYRTPQAAKTAAKRLEKKLLSCERLIQKDYCFKTFSLIKQFQKKGA